MKRSVVTMFALTSIFMAAGCGDNSDERAGEPPVSPISITDVASFSLPLDAYLPTRQQEAMLQNARNLLQLECLRRFGFDYAVGEIPAKPLTRNERRYGLANEERAAIYGYREPRINNRQRPNEPQISEAAEFVLTGRGQGTHQGQPIPEGGCSGEAARKLNDGAPQSADANLAEMLSAESLHRSEKDSRVVAAFARWSECMRKKGYHYSRPRDANNDINFTGEVASEREIMTAVTDTQCKRETNLITEWAAVDTAYQLREINKRGEQLVSAKQLLEVRLRNAARVVGK